MSKGTIKAIALFFLITFSIQTFYPVTVYALTSGPSQPEMAKFEAAGAGDLVDLFTGDFKYNIPLMDVGGYPVNISYQSEGGMEDEASWVGMGWTLNPGAVNRNMRGLPDDFDGSKAGGEADKIKKEFNKKAFKKVGGQLVTKVSVVGWEVAKLNGSYSVNVYKDNYFGIGASIGASMGFSLSKNSQTSLTAGLNLDINSDTRDGVNITPGFSLSNDYANEMENSSLGLSGGFQYNNRSGLKSTSLGASFSTTNLVGQTRGMDFSATSYFGQTHTPSIKTSTSNEQYTFSVDGGGTVFGLYFGGGGSGYLYKEKNTEPSLSLPAFGYLNYVKGRKNENAVIDFNREKDGVFIKSAPSIPMPVATHDFFVATGQAGSQQFRPYYGSNYVVFDRANRNTSTAIKAGVTLGFGNAFKAGGRLDYTSGKAESKKWVNRNLYLPQGEVAFANTPTEEPVYFKQAGEQTLADIDFLDKIGHDKTSSILINKTGANLFALPTFRHRIGIDPVPAIKRQARKDKRTSTFSYLNTIQAGKYGLDKKINDESRWTANRKKHHISEVTVTDKEGKRMIYGIPVYNNYQDEVTFSVKAPTGNDLLKAKQTGIISYNQATDASFQNRNGREELYMKETVPAYATGFLLTGMLSPDYVDATGNGISDDDLGTAVKFRYARHTDSYKWRAPYHYDPAQANALWANYNEGFLSDPKDDKASYVAGSKEVWYLDTIVSKTMIAIFERSSREDGLGVNAGGIKDNNATLQKLDRIKLYSKADWFKDKGKAIPVKIVHFEYDYSLYPGIPNNTGRNIDKNGTIISSPNPDTDPANVNKERGKLTLKKVYFTFGTSTRGVSNPYEFNYDMVSIHDPSGTVPSNTLVNESGDKYTQRQNDRWGNYKQSFYNRIESGQPVLSNSEFPYTLQKNYPPANVTEQDWGKLIDRMISKWKLNSITTPSGSIISVEYENDDYAYVQNKRAMQMCIVKGINTIGNFSGLSGKRSSGTLDKILVEVPVAVSSAADFEKKYLLQSDGKPNDKLFYKFLVDMDGRGHHEYVHGYAEISLAALRASTVASNAKIIAIPIKNIGDYNAIAKAAWQMLKTDLPMYAYDSYDNSEISDDFKAAIKSIIAAFKNARPGEILKPFEKTASGKKFADKMILSKSMVRLSLPDNTPGNKKTGGGSRVKKVQISDEWQAMLDGTPNIKTAKYGQLYDYSIRDKAGNITGSSGVAAYEPQIGNEENPFHEPVNYTEKVHWSSDRYHYIEKPFCETYFPGPTVGYSKVSVTSFGDDYDGITLTKHTGHIENEFYTAKDFPTLVDHMPLHYIPYENSLLIKLFASTSVNRVATSQGFRVELNDMHGKPKSVKVFDKAGDLISSAEYMYQVKEQSAQTKELDNNVEVLNEQGIISKSIIATDADFTTDVRQSTNESIGASVGAYPGGMALAWFYIGYFGINFSHSVNIDNYHSIACVKVIHKYGILKKTVTMQNGSSISAENLLWDPETGDVLLTKTQTEFDDYTYAFTYPAYRAEGQEGMGAAFKNLGSLFTNMNVGPNGDISSYSSYLFPGDELVLVVDDLNTSVKGWVTKSTLDGSLHLIDADGNFITTNGDYYLMRSGRRNHLSAGTGTLVFRENPINGTTIDLDVTKKILDAKAIVYKNEWGVPVPEKLVDEVECLTVFARSGYLFDNGTTAPECNSLFFGARTTLHAGFVETARSFIDFNATSNLPANLKIQSVKLSMLAAWNYPTDPMLGNNQAYLKRIVQPVSCNPDLVWSTEPAVTNVNMVLLPTSTNPKQDYPDIDITGMFKAWYSAKDIPSFGIRINLDNEGSPPARHMMFLGPYTAKNLGPKIEICYLKKVCADPENKAINPYVQGVLGNWRPQVTYAYVVNREQKAGNPAQNGGTNIRTSGSYSAYHPFWSWDGTANKFKRTFSDDDNLLFSDARSRWTWTNKSIYFDQKGNEVESTAPPSIIPAGTSIPDREKYNHYSSALFGYNGSVATAVAANARRNEIVFDGFEDYDFALDYKEICLPKRHFDFGFVKHPVGTWQSPLGVISNAIAHTGKYSFKLNSGATITKPAGGLIPDLQLLTFNNDGSCILNSNELGKGFAPINFNNKKYVLSLWVYEGTPNTPNPPNLTNTVDMLTVKVNNQYSYPTEAPAGTFTKFPVPVVEGWKRIEMVFTAGSEFKLELQPTGEVYIDDIRIFPFDGQMNSFVYDNRSMKLVAQLDENNFATFYEYDDEGTPIRVKKETERGIMTLKENRQSLRKRN